MIQPFKNITVVMKDATNSGMTAATTSYVNTNRLKDDKRYHFVSVNSDGLGVMSVVAATNPVVGVLMNSFDKPMVPSEVCVSGIVPVVVGTAVTAGTPVSADATGSAQPFVADTAANRAGIALTSGQAGEYVDVLLDR